jgi:hypothetical protein
MSQEECIDGEIVGIHGTTNGRTCELHDVCGSEVKVNTLIRFKFCSIEIHRRVEPAVNAVFIGYGEECCTVGFLPRAVSLQAGAKDVFHDEFAVIVCLHEESDDVDVREDSRRVLGKASFRLLRNIPSLGLRSHKMA